VTILSKQSIVLSDGTVDDLAESLVEYCAARLSKNVETVEATRLHLSHVIGDMVLDSVDSTMTRAGRWVLRRLRHV